MMPRPSLPLFSSVSSSRLETRPSTSSSSMQPCIRSKATFVCIMNTIQVGMTFKGARIIANKEFAVEAMLTVSWFPSQMQDAKETTETSTGARVQTAENKTELVRDLTNR